MSGPSDVGLLPRTFFKMPRVPFDFRAVALAVLAYLVWWGGAALLTKIAGGGVNPCGAFLAWFIDLFRGLIVIDDLLRAFLGNVFGSGSPAAASTLETVLGGVWFFAVWSFFGQAIRRTVALRIARDEGLSLLEALTFAARNWVHVLIAPLVVVALAGAFWVCNLAAGAAMSIPYLGGILALLLVPLAALSTLLMLLILLGGLMGLPLMGAAAAWERNGTLDALSRAFTYVFARPLQYFLNYFLIFAFTAIVLYVGNWFIFGLTKSIDSGVWNDKLSVLIDAPPQAGVTNNDSEWNKLDPDARDRARKYGEATGYTGRASGGRDWARGDTNRPFAQHWGAVANTGLDHWLTSFVFWLFLNLIWLGVFGYAVFWFLGASCCLYADLRYDVDGTEEDEIHTDEDDAPPAAAAPTGTAGTPPAAPAPGSLPAGTPPAAGDAPPPPPASA